MHRVCRAVWLLVAWATVPPFMYAQTTPTAPATVDHTPPDGPYYPGLPKSSSRLQFTAGDFTVRFYGTVLLNLSMAGTAQVGQDVPLWPLPGSSLVTFPDGTTKRAGLVHDTIFTARQSILGLQVSSAKPYAGWRSISSGRGRWTARFNRPTGFSTSRGCAALICNSKMGAGKSWRVRTK
jgi:hypothetical protein